MEFCEREREVVAAVIAGAALQDDLKNHAHSCAACSQALEIARGLAELAASELEEPMPTAGVMLWKAKLRERQAGNRRSEQILRWAGWCAGAWLLITTAGVAALTLPHLPGSNGVLWIGLGVFACVLASSGAVLAFWCRIDQ
jgi:hypothetical protein